MLTFISPSIMMFENAGIPGADETSNIGEVPLYSFCYDTIGKNLYFCADNTINAMVWQLVTFII